MLYVKRRVAPSTALSNIQGADMIPDTTNDTRDIVSENLTLNNRSVSEVLVESLPLAIILLDKNGLIKDHNSAASTFLGNTLRNKKWIDIIHQSFSPRSDDGLEISLRDGRRLLVATYSLPNQLGQVIIAQDVTQSRLLQTKISQQERLIAMGKMTAALAHQIRTPLASAFIYAEHLGNLGLTEEKREQFSTNLVERLKAIETQIKDMLLFVKEQQFVLETISVEVLLEEFKLLVSETMFRNNIEAHFTTNANNNFVQINKESLLGCLMNIINNSIECKKADLKLEVIFKVLENKQLLISIRDNGIGMSEEVLSQAREAFFTTRENGTGLGLAIVHEVLKAHNGNLIINSELGMGTEVICSVPLLSQIPEQSTTLSHQG